MCGITGAIWSDPRCVVEPAVLRRMTDVLGHRGPDDRGVHRCECRAVAGGTGVPGVGLGFRRLSIIDLESARQPLANEDESIWMVFNGEIYNFAALRHRLEAGGHTFRTHGDGETIIHLYEDLGTDCFTHLNGMFAIALWDATRGRLVLARDRLGQKPLVYRTEPGRLLFASELKSLLQVPGISRDVDLTALDHYLTYQYVPHPWSILRGFQKLPLVTSPSTRKTGYAPSRIGVQIFMKCGTAARQMLSISSGPCLNPRSVCECKAMCRWVRSCLAGSIHP